jgi:hypothetical protein
VHYAASWPAHGPRKEYQQRPRAVPRGHRNRYTIYHSVSQAPQCVRSSFSRRHRDRALKSLVLLLGEYLNWIPVKHENGFALSAASAGQAWVRQHGLPPDPATISQHAICHRKLRAEHRRTYMNIHACDVECFLGLKSLERDTRTCNMQTAGLPQEYVQRPCTVPHRHHNNNKIEFITLQCPTCIRTSFSRRHIGRVWRSMVLLMKYYRTSTEMMSYIQRYPFNGERSPSMGVVAWTATRSHCHQLAHE